MAQRRQRKFLKIPSEQVMGEDSFVVVKRPGFGDLEGIDLGALVEAKESGKITIGVLEALVPMLKRIVVDWDWVDDEGNPLAKPKDDPDVIDALHIDEQTFIVDNIDFGDVEDPKNLR